ncbi:MAG: exopolysaccharide biosynthesis polyprenyl glycosylphosphotransferase [Ekhidna sp.]|nr:exopolysaccharide biosynthesis polyprenyl glycosylphosphotransferase [Ekhidna sp.]
MMGNIGISKYKTYLLLLDIVLLNVSVLVAHEIRFNSIIPSSDYQTLQLVLNILWVLVFFVSGLSRVDLHSGYIDHINKFLTGLVINLSIVFAIWFLLQPVGDNDISLLYSRKFLFITFLLFSISAIPFRLIWVSFINKRFARIVRILLIGNTDQTQQLDNHFRREKADKYEVIGAINDTKASSIEEYLSTNKPDVILCSMSYLDDDDLKNVIDFAENNLIKVQLISQFSQLLNYSFSMAYFDNMPVLNINSIPLDNSLNQIIKRLFDFVFSAIFIFLILSWLIPLIAILIKMDSKGPVFFKQARHGKGNQLFQCWKFRTMKYEKNAIFKQATKSDDRITKVGKILRKTSIDEIPQFINVFLGDMSVVGPRPHPIKLNEEFQVKIDRFWQRHAVKPGITGLAQAKGFRGETAEFSDMSGRVRLDRFYVRNWSLFLDVKIIMLTALSIMKGSKNAY